MLERRLKSCVEAWPECADGEYSPACCRFPKSCSPHPYPEALAAHGESILEPAGDLHVETPLTDISVAYQGAAQSFLADAVFPRVPIGGRSSYYDGSYPAPEPRLPRYDQVPMHDINLATGHHPLVQDILTDYLHTIRDLGERLEPVDLEEWSISDDDWGESRKGYTLVDGRHRFTAHLIAGLPTIWARIKP